MADVADFELRAQGRWLVDHRREMEQGESGWLDALTRFDDEGGWAIDGQLSCVDWLRWMTKMARSTCYEKLHLAHSLQEHHRVAEAFRAGRISYSAARLICRLEGLDPDTEDTLVRLAEQGTLKELEQAAEFYRQLADQERPPPDPHLHRAVRVRPDLDGWAKVEILMPMVEAKELNAVLDAFMAVDRRQHQGSNSAAAHTDDRHTDAAASRAAPDQADRAGTEEGSAGADDHDGHAGTGSPDEAGAGASAHADDHDGHAGTGSPDKAGAGASAGADGRDGERQRRADEADDAAEAERAADADLEDEQGVGEPAEDRATGTDRWRASRGLAFTEMVRCALAHVDGGRALGDDRYLVHVVARAGQLTLLDGTPIDAATAAEITCDASVVAHTVDGHGEPLHQGRKTREWSTAQRRAVLVRDGGRCRFPGCERRVRDIHHRQPWEAGGLTDVDNGMAVCRAHHTLLHHGFVVHGQPGGVLSFDRPDGTRIGTTSPAQRALALAA